MIKLYSWNVNGIRATSQKEGFFPWFCGQNADIIAFQETKAAPEQLGEELLNPYNYLSYWSSSLKKKGYSGVVAYSKMAPLGHTSELPQVEFQGEGRLIHLEYPQFHFFNVYFPNGQKDDVRLQYKLGYYDAFLNYAEELRQKKPIVVCGDFNTAHQPIDLARPKENETTSGYLPIERAWLDKFIAAGYATAKLGELAMDPGNQEKQQSALAGATMPGGKEFWRAAADKASE